MPTVVAFDLHTPYPIGDVVLWADSPEGYFACLEQALQRVPCINRIRFAYRWTNLRLLGCSVDIGDVVPNSDAQVLPPYRTPKAAAAIEEIVIGGRTALNINRERLFAVRSGDTAAVEFEALKRQLRRCIRLLCTGEDCTDDFRLFYARRPTSGIPDGYDAVFIDGGETIEWRMSDRSVRRRSHMAKRLAMLAGQNVDGPVQ